MWVRLTVGVRVGVDVGVGMVVLGGRGKMLMGTGALCCCTGVWCGVLCCGECPCGWTYGGVGVGVGACMSMRVGVQGG